MLFRSSKIESSEYRVIIDAQDGQQTRIVEDEAGVWIETANDRLSLTQSPVRLPRFESHPNGALLRALHSELLVNVMPVGPVPNLWVYPRPWYRDAAMMLMCFEKTGNLSIVEPWIAGLHKMYDRNNNGDPEPDNLGQVLYMISLTHDRQHPLAERIIKEAGKWKKDYFIIGRTDGGEHPVYQTKWLKLGLRSLGLDDPYRIPPIVDSYSPLFWMDYRDEHIEGPRFSPRAAELYPYLSWAEAHFYNETPLVPSDLSHLPLTWEGEGSEADYWRMKILSSGLAEMKTCVPHTWHAAEMFLMLFNKGSL